MSDTSAEVSPLPMLAHLTREEWNKVRCIVSGGGTEVVNGEYRYDYHNCGGRPRFVKVDGPDGRDPLAVWWNKNEWRIGRHREYFYTKATTSDEEMCEGGQWILCQGAHAHDGVRSPAPIVVLARTS